MALKPIFKEYGAIDVTNFDATPENPKMGYLCGGIVSVFSDGRIIIHDANEDGVVLEDFHLCDLMHINTNINNYDPDHLTEIALMIPGKSIRITFEDVKTKDRFAETLVI